MVQGDFHLAETIEEAVLPQNESGIQSGASVINCCYAELLLCCERHPRLIDNDQDGRFSNMTFSDTQRTIAGGKISLNVSRRLVSPACIAGVLTSPPNFSAL